MGSVGSGHHPLTVSFLLAVL
uniref:Uncharacterized protein n=1 Tax=Anguilla anguilla TaxID=7936 RepID=A0A0E9WCG2_ANGAN